MGIGVPKFEINAKRVESTTEINIISVGFGIHNAWTYAAMYGATTLFHIEGISQTVPLGALFYGSLAVFSLVLFIIAAFDRKIPFSACRKTLVLAAAASMCIGTLILFAIPVTTGAAQMFSFALSSLLTGVGSAFLVVMWGIHLATHERATIVGNVALSFVVAAVIHVALIAVVFYPVSGIIAACLPLLEALILLKAKAGSFGINEHVDLSSLPVRRGRVVCRLVLPLAAICFGLSLLKGRYALDIITGDTPISALHLIAATAIAFCVLFFSISAISKSSSSEAVLRPALCIAAIAALLVPFISPGHFTVASTIVMAGYFTLEAAVFTYPCILSQECRISTPFLFGFVRGCMAACVIAVGICNTAFQGWSNLPWGASSLIVVILMCFVLGYALFPNQERIATEALTAASNEADIDFETLSVRETKHETTLPENIAAEQQESASGSPVSEDEPAQKEEALRRLCELTANRNLLSRREAEVLLELARGYNCSRIQEDLFIAEGTVRTHIRHIYEKLNVHSQQELIRFVESQKN